MGVKVYKIGAHRAHDEVLRRICLNKQEGVLSDVFYFCETAYGQFEEQMTSCRKVINDTGNTVREVYKLVSGKRKEAIDAVKIAYHGFLHLQVREYTNEHWKQLETYYHE